MKTFPFDRLVPVGGYLEAVVAHNSLDDMALGVRYSLRLDFEPIIWTNRRCQPMLNLDNMHLGVRSWRELSGTTHSFPEQPATVLKEGQLIPIEDAVYGELRLGDLFFAARLTRIHFGQVNKGHVSTHIRVMAILADPFVPSNHRLDLQVTLEIRPVRVLGDLAFIDPPNLEEAMSLAVQVLDLEDYAAPIFNQVYVLPLKDDD